MGEKVVEVEVGNWKRRNETSLARSPAQSHTLTCTRYVHRTRSILTFSQFFFMIKSFIWQSVHRFAFEWQRRHEMNTLGGSTRSHPSSSWSFPFIFLFLFSCALFVPRFFFSLLNLGFLRISCVWMWMARTSNLQRNGNHKQCNRISLSRAPHRKRTRVNRKWFNSFSLFCCCCRCCLRTNHSKWVLFEAFALRRRCCYFLVVCAFVYW